jgi:quinol monooxygenase YgiN
MRFTAVTLRVGRAGLGPLRDDLASSGAPVWALLAGQIGVPAGELELVVAGDEVPTFTAATAVRTLALEATARPRSTTPPGLTGIYALREFLTDARDVDELVALSAEAWPTFEGDNPGVQVLGLFRVVDEPGRLLLVTRYPDLAAWEGSRNSPEFQRRNALTKASIVRTYRPIA